MSGPAREMGARSHSASSLLRAALEGALTRGKVLDRAHAQFGDYVVVLTAPGAPRMPNGIECGAAFKPGDRVAIGGGRLVAGRDVVRPGRPWDPRPAVTPAHVWPPGPAPVAAEAGVGAVWQDEVLAGYVAGLVLLHGQHARAKRLAEAAAATSPPLVATMLRHAALGEVPEPVHELFGAGHLGALTTYGAGSGAAWLRGLVSAGYALDVTVLGKAAVAGVR